MGVSELAILSANTCWRWLSQSMRLVSAAIKGIFNKFMGQKR